MTRTVAGAVMPRWVASFVHRRETDRANPPAAVSNTASSDTDVPDWNDLQAGGTSTTKTPTTAATPVIFPPISSVANTTAESMTAMSRSPMVADSAMT